jgi:hypothetical protein
MKKELITEESVEALVMDMSKEDRNALSMYTYMMMMAFAKKDNYKIAIVFDNTDSSGVAAINMTAEELMGALAETHANMYKVITQDMPSKDMLN